MGPIMCPRCKDEQETKFQEVKKYVQDNHGADIIEVSEACDVDPGQIRQWVREERLQFADDSPIRIACEGCGIMIRSGRYCDKCKMEMTNGFKSVMEPKSTKKPETPKKSKAERDKMRFL